MLVVLPILPLIVAYLMERGIQRIFHNSFVLFFELRFLRVDDFFVDVDCTTRHIATRGKTEYHYSAMLSLSHSDQRIFCAH